MRYHQELLHEDDYPITVPKSVKNEIVRDYLSTTYYWTVGILCFIIGLLTGVAL